MSEEIKDAKFATGAVRSADVDHLDFASLPLLGLLGVMKVAGCGAPKYGRFNYAKGMPVHVTLNHVAVHFIRYLLGDRTEDHLSKMAWGAMVANETALLHPELADPHLLGPGATLTAAMLTEMAKGDEERAAKRKAKEFEELFLWTLGDMPEVQEIIAQRNNVEASAVEKPKENILVPEVKAQPRTPSHAPVPWSELGDNLARINGSLPLGTVCCGHLNLDYISLVCRDCGATKNQMLAQMPGGKDRS